MDAGNLQSFRQDFPLLNRCTYLNSAFTSLTPEIIADKIRDFYVNHRGSTVGIFEYVLKDMDAAYRQVAQLLGAQDENGESFTDNIAVCASCSDAVAKVFRSIYDLDMLLGRNIVLSSIEYCSNISYWTHLQRRLKFEIKIVPHNWESNSLSLCEMERYIDRCTVLVIVSHVSSFNGEVRDVARICEVARSFGAITLVDGAQACSTIPIDVIEIGCDFYVYSGHKALGPTGASILYASMRGAEILDACGSETSFVDDGLPAYTRFWTDSMSNTQGILALGWAAEYVIESGIHNICSHIADIRRELQRELQNFKLFKDQSSDDSVNMVTVEVQRARANIIYKRLRENNIVCLPLSEGSFPLEKDRISNRSFIRMSLHAYNNEDDIISLCSCLSSIG